MLKINEVERIYLGIQGENNARPITIDVSPWIMLYPNGSVTIWHKRNGDSVPEATGAVYDSETMTVTWTPDDVDTYVDGEGDAEIRLTDTNVIKKSKWIKTCVSPSVTLAGTTLGSDWASYINAVDGLRAGAVAAKNAAVTAKNAAETAESNAEAWAVGQRGGEDVESTDPAYQNNAKYYKEQAAGSASTASTASTDAVAAKNAAVAAQGAAEVAQLAAVVAQGKAETAQAAAENAQSAAESAQSSAETAKTGAISAKNDAISAKNDAVTAKNAAVNAQGAAENSATTASTKAGEAATSATTASTKAGEAATSAGTASTKASEAAASAGAAGTSALKAEGYAVGDQNGTPVTSGSPYYHNNAEYYAGQASDSATAASGSATTAGNKALVAEGYANGKQNGTPVTSGSDYYQNNAKYFSEEAADSATEAAGYADDAADSAAAAEATTTMIAPAFAEATANDPGTYVTNSGVLYYLPDGHEANVTWANTTKTEVKVGSELAGVKSALNQSKAPVILDTASGEIVTIPDGADGLDVKTLTVAIEPIQDLHGQSNPYPGGGSKNKLPLTLEALKAENYPSQWSGNTLHHFTVNTVDGNVESISVNAPASSGNTMQLTFTLPAGTYYLDSGFTENQGLNDTYIQKNGTTIARGNAQSPGRTFTLTEESELVFYIRYYANAQGGVSYKAYPMVCLNSESDKSYVPYSNICPISGWSAAEVVRTGKNLAKLSFIGIYNLTTGQPNQTSSSTYASTEKIMCNGDTDYVGSASFTITQMLVYYWDANGNYIQSDVISNSPWKFTTLSNAKYVAVTFRKSSDSSSLSDFTNVQLEPGTTASDYEAYQGVTKTYTFPNPPGTVYGGTLTVNADGTGKLVVDRAIINMGSMGWGYDSTNSRFYSGSLATNDIKKVNQFTTDLFRCSALKTGDGAVNNISLMKDHEICSYLNGYIYARSLEYEDADNFKTAYTGQYIWYTVATPTTYNLTDLEVIELLKGVNNLWADCGNVSIEYPCDTKLFIERLTAPTEDDMIANANIASGRFFMVGNNLFISTSAIAQGETIIPGTNCTAVSLADALNAINQ